MSPRGHADLVVRYAFNPEIKGFEVKKVFVLGDLIKMIDMSAESNGNI